MTEQPLQPSAPAPAAPRRTINTAMSQGRTSWGGVRLLFCTAVSASCIGWALILAKMSMYSDVLCGANEWRDIGLAEVSWVFQEQAPAQAATTIQKMESMASPDQFTVDILSMASVNQLDLLNAQKNTFASHVSVRNFFNATEIDDSDPDCHTKLTWDGVRQISAFCRGRRGGLEHIFYYMRGQYAREQWLAKKVNPVGWICAQVRPYSGLIKAYQHYVDTGERLPDYFIIMDDDTYYNMELFQQNFQAMNSTEDTYHAGCLVRSPVHMVNFTFPFGGFGSIFSKGALRNLFRPIDCLNSSPVDVSAHEKNSMRGICDRLDEDNVKEKQYFNNSMNLVELMYHYVSTEKYRDVERWKAGYCMHSDWVIGYFVNFYNVSKHVVEPFYKDVPHARMEAYKGSEIYRKGTGFCNNERDCKPGVDICHRATPQWMAAETTRWAQKVPEKYGQ